MSYMESDNMNITIDGKTIDEVGAEIDARSEVDKHLRKEARSIAEPELAC